MKKEFYSNGKLLITGEYLVLDGAKSLALPTKFGQKLIVEEGKNQLIKWTSYDTDGSIWFEEKIDFEEIKQYKNHNISDSIKNTLLKILHQAYLVNPIFIDNFDGHTVKTLLTFPRNWGLGTSSTLINNIGQWLQINSFDLLYTSFGGSGYDIACAQHNYPILFQLNNGIPIVEKIDFKPDFSENLYFVYLDKKQSSKDSIISYKNTKKEFLLEEIKYINEITKSVVNAYSLNEFSIALEKHEETISNILKINTVKELLFQDFNGVVKSLGAWGGDFVLVIAENNPVEYFYKKGFKTVIPYEKMIL